MATASISLAVDTKGQDGQNRFLHLKTITLDFKGNRPNCKVEVKIKVDDELRESHTFPRGTAVTWEKDLYVSSLARIEVTVYKVRLGVQRRYAAITVSLGDVPAKDGCTHEVADEYQLVQAILTFGTALDTKHVLDLLGADARLALGSKVTILDRIAKVSVFAEKVIDVSAKAFELGAAISEVNGVAKAVFNVAGLAFKKLQQQRDCHKAAVELMVSLSAKLPFTDIIPKNIRSAQIRASLQSMLTVMEQALRFLIDYVQMTAHKDLLFSQQGAIADFKEKLKDALTDFHVSLSAQHLTITYDFKQTEMLKKLNPVAAAQFSQGGSCMDGTRMVPLEHIMVWSEGSTPSRLFWVHGLAGSGKSTIAATVCERLREKGALAGTFFCKRDVPDQRDPRRILPTIASTLAKVHKPYRDVVADLLETEEDISTSPLSYQLSSLFVTPFATLQQHEGQSLVFVIDALDECGDKITRRQIAECLHRVATLANWLRIFITSRPLPELAQIFEPSKSPSVAAIDLSEIDAKSDILLYTKFRIEELVSDQRLNERWLHDDALDQLAKKASGLFIWTSTVIEFVANEYLGDAAMDAILVGSREDGSRSSLDSLYMTVLQNTRGGHGSKNISILNTVLGTIRVTAKNKPLSIDGLYDFMPASLHLQKEALASILKDLRSVLYEDSLTGNVIRVCHPSFLDFLEYQDRCGEYWTNLEQLDQMMTEKCLNLMRAGLRFNICSLESSYKANEEVPDLQQRIKNSISESLQYGCLYWAGHFSGANRGTTDELVAKFFNGLQVLHWLEVLSLIGGLKTGLDALQTVIEIYKDQTEICKIAIDAYRFISSTYDAISYSTPHLYASALTWLPEESPMLLLHPHFKTQPSILTGRFKEWHRTRWMNAMDGWVWQVVFSPDGRNVVACSSDRTIGIYEAKTGLMVKKLKGHTGAVMEIAFSPNGRLLASGSEDDTILIWNIDTGLAVGEPLFGHTSTVYSVCYSPDGQFIASRSLDTTVRIWDASSGQELRQMATGYSSRGRVVYSPVGRKLAFCGDEGIKLYNTESWELLSEVDQVGCVPYIAYSPNGSYLASAGVDGTVRLWNGDTLTNVAILYGHDSYVYSAAFSPDGKELLSASGDTTLIRWDTTSFQIIDKLSRAHDAPILSAEYSPDNCFIASGSMDNSVRLWDVQSVSKESSSSQPGHVFTAARSPNGMEFASGTEKGVVRIHDANSGAVAQSLAGHSGSVNAVAYSSDGSLLASASSDYTILIWNAEAGIELYKLEGHSKMVNSVIFTSDGQHVISASDDGTVRRWYLKRLHTSSGDIMEVLLSQSAQVYSVCLSPDGKLLASSGRDNFILFSDSSTGTEAGERCTSDASIRTLAFSPDGKYVASGSEDSSIQIWDVDARRQVRSLKGHPSFVLSVAFTQDGKNLLSACGRATIRQWDLETGKELHKLLGHTDTIWSAVYLANEKRILSASDDGTVRIWNADRTQNTYVAEIDQELASLPLVNGWVKSREGELLLWVPPEYRNGIRDMCEVCIPADAPGHPVRLDWSKLVKGEEWTSILKDPSRQD